MQVIFDTQTAVIDLRAAGFKDEQAQAIVTVIKNSQAELVTRRDMLDLKKDLIIWLGTMMVFSFGVSAGLLTYIIN